MPTTKTAPDRHAVVLAPTDRVAIVAGSGALPLVILDSLVQAGTRPFVVTVIGEADDDPRYEAFERESLALGQFAQLIPLLKRHGVTHLVLAGGISRRPRWSEISLDLRLVPVLWRAVKALALGDDGLLRALVRGIEGEGIRVVGAHEVAPDLLAATGTLTAAAPKASDRRDIDAALAAARAIGALDIGQGAVAIGGRAIALEGIEGTDLMLQRVAGLRGHGRLAGRTRGVLVKCSKPGQELRADLPTIGPATVEGAHAAGLAGIGVEAGRTLVLDHAGTVARADALGLFVVGLDLSAPP